MASYWAREFDDESDNKFRVTEDDLQPQNLNSANLSRNDFIEHVSNGQSSRQAAQATASEETRAPHDSNAKPSCDPPRNSNNEGTHEDDDQSKVGAVWVQCKE